MFSGLWSEFHLEAVQPPARSFCRSDWGKKSCRCSSIALPMAQPPSSPHEVLEVLHLSLSPDPAALDHACQLLGHWAHAPSFYSYLVDVFTTREGIQLEVRLQAALQFKNGVERYWRKGALQ